jgi:hypothetical protein
MMYKRPVQNLRDWGEDQTPGEPKVGSLCLTSCAGARPGWGDLSQLLPGKDFSFSLTLVRHWFGNSGPFFPSCALPGSGLPASWSILWPPPSLSAPDSPQTPVSGGLMRRLVSRTEGPESRTWWSIWTVPTWQQDTQAKLGHFCGLRRALMHTAHPRLS